MVSRVAGSAQWRSSTTNSTGPSSESRWNTPEHRVEQSSLERLGLGRGGVGLGGRTERWHEASQIRPCVPDDGGQLIVIQLADEAPQGFDDRAVRETAVTDVRAAAVEHAHPAGRCHRRRLGHEARLADAGLAGDELMNRGCGFRAVEGVRDG